MSSPPEPTRALPSLPDLLRACAAGREEYAKSAGGSVKHQLQGEANALYSAARLAEGVLHTAYAPLPSWRWHEAGLPDPQLPYRLPDDRSQPPPDNSDGVS